MSNPQEQERNIEEQLQQPLLEEEEVQSIIIDNDHNNFTPIAKRNVYFTLIYTVLAFAGRSIWSQSVLATFIFLLKHNNPEAVGYITAIMGIAQLIASFPAGYIADSYRRDILLQVASIMGVVSIICTSFACWYEKYIYLVPALAVWGVYYGITNTTITALFADSIPDGERSYYFTHRSILITLGNTAGPICALSLFAILGNNWKIRDCALVMILGQLICLPAILILCFFRDNDDDDDDEDDDHFHDALSTPHDDQDDNVCSGNPCITDEEQALVESSEQNNTVLNVNRDNNTDEENNNSIYDDEEYDDGRVMRCFNVTNGIWCIRKRWVIPTFIAIGDVISGLGSGMSIRYFPIFFVHNIQLSPVGLQIIYVSFPILQAILMKLAQRLAMTYGRCHITVYFRWLGIILMFCMITTYILYGIHAWIPICILFIIRTGCMNCCGALTRSMLMDNVPSNLRARFSALESVNMFSWSGSAALGGLLVGVSGIIPLFAITASIQIISSLFLVALWNVDTIESPATTTTTRRLSQQRTS